MLKKAGIVVAVAAAGVLSLSPLAFATDGHHDTPHHEDHHSQTHVDRSVAYTNVERDNLSNDCEFGQQGADVDATATGGSSLLGLAGLVTSVIAPVTTQTQLLNCTNIGVSDVIDFNSNNEDTTVTRTEIEDSGNTVIDD